MNYSVGLSNFIFFFCAILGQVKRPLQVKDPNEEFSVNVATYLADSSNGTGNLEECVPNLG